VDCAGAAERRAPLLLEAPRGHVVFKRVVDDFQTSWKAWPPCPDVKKVYKILEHPRFVAAYDTYQTGVNAEDPSQARGGTHRLWHGTARECNLGDPGHVELCSSITCFLCSAIRSSFDITGFPNGIHTSSTTDKSDKYSKNGVSSPSKAMLLTNVITGKRIKLTRDRLPLNAPPQGYDSVELVGSRNGRPVSLDELIVYTGDAIRPTFLVVYN